MYQEIQQKLLKNPKTWLITGVAGFIGCNILKKLLTLNQKVIGIDNLTTGKLENIYPHLNQFEFHQADITNRTACHRIFEGMPVDYVLHQAAISSVQYSMLNPEVIQVNNVEGFRNILDISIMNNVKTFVYASSSAVYGDSEDIFKTEQNIGKLLSPYASSKYINEQIAEQYQASHKIKTVGLRYFNIYGQNQDPNGIYAAVVPKWISAVLTGSGVVINGDGTTTRDFCNVSDVVQANLLACHIAPCTPRIFNIGTGKSQNLNFLLQTIIRVAEQHGVSYDIKPEYRNFIEGDVKHSCSDITRAKKYLRFYPKKDLENGLSELIQWQIFNKQVSDKIGS